MSATKLPALCDLHVHFREPGFSYKETIATGCAAAAHGGYTAVCTMPNLKPVADSIEHLKLQLDCIAKDASIKVYPYGAISLGQEGKALSDLEGMAPMVIAFSDDGKGVQSDELMREAMLKAKALGRIIVAHCEVNELLNGGYIHDGVYAKEHNHRGICSKSEWAQVQRDIELARETGCSYHVCHVSTAESVELVRQAKADGLDISCEVTPHHLLLDETMLREDGNFKMNPPLRSKQDREALIEGIKDGTIEIIATDHAPHSAEEKSRGLEGSAFGIVGLETAFPLLYTELVRGGIITLDELIALMSVNPSKRFGIDLGDDYAEWELDTEYEIHSRDFLSKGKSMPWEGRKVYGLCTKTVCNGKTVYER